MSGVSGISADSILQMRNAILQKNSALRDAASPSSAGGVGGLGGIGGTVGGTGGTGGTQAGDFTAALKSALNQVNSLQNNASDAATAFEKGETTDIAAVMMAKQTASVGFEATLQVRNKLLSAYKDIMSMPV